MSQLMVGMVSLALNVGTQVRNVNAIISLNCCFNIVRCDSMRVIYARENKLHFINGHSSQRLARCVHISNVSRPELYAGPPLVTHSKGKLRSIKRYIVNARALVILYAELISVLCTCYSLQSLTYLDMAKR